MVIPAGSGGKLNINGGVGEVTVTVAADAAVRLMADAGIANVNLPESFTRVKGGKHFVGVSGIWESANFAEAEKQIIIDFDGGVGSFSLEYIRSVMSAAEAIPRARLLHGGGLDLAATRVANANQDSLWDRESAGLPANSARATRCLLRAAGQSVLHHAVEHLREMAAGLLDGHIGADNGDFVTEHFHDAAFHLKFNRCEFVGLFAPE